MEYDAFESLRNLTQIAYYNVSDKDETIDMHFKNIKNELEAGETNKKALKILCDRKVEIAYFKDCETLEDYNSIWGFMQQKRRLTQDEFDFLKKVVL